MDVLRHVINSGSILVTQDINFVKYVSKIKLVLLHFNPRRTSWQDIFNAIQNF